MHIHLLDVGQTKYGDCILITHGDRRMLIDGAHASDTDAITNQLATLLAQAPPFALDLLIVTHCHSDHIGCLPNLIDQNIIRPATALVADEKIGYGRDVQGAGPADALAPVRQILFSALLEEDRSDLPDNELSRFIQDAADLEARYITMLNTLKARGTALIRYTKNTDPQIRQLETDFADFGLKILGPTASHLVVCAQALGSTVGPENDGLSVLSDDATPHQLTDTYRQFCREIHKSTTDGALGAADRPGVGAAKNNQSIVLSLEADGWKALLAGDMQFAKPEVPGLTDLMKALRQRVVAAGPYDFIKLTHHSSDNGLDMSVLAEWTPTALLAHTGGKNDPGHPDNDVLTLLKNSPRPLTFARTDHNGLITVTKTDRVRMTISRGVTNDFEPNKKPDELPAAPVAQPLPLVAPVIPEAVVPVVTEKSTTDGIEVIVKLPNSATRITLIIEVDPEKKKVISDPDSPVGKPAAPSGLQIGAGRPLPALLLITSWQRLARNIGRDEAAQVRAAIAQLPNFTVIDLPDAIKTAEEAVVLVRPLLLAGAIDGVLLLGGYDVVPSGIVDVLDNQTRLELENEELDGQDADNFYVWSDDLYGDRDGDSFPELPVSRIPDGRRADLVFAALQATQAPLQKFGVRNQARPFAASIFNKLPGQAVDLQVSATFGPADIQHDAALGAVYYMLHGSDLDGTRYWGETPGGSIFEAMTIANVPQSAPGSIVFTGCCWGALVVSPAAFRVRPQTALRPRGPEGSIALAYLRAGALSFVGCTGSHYSPLESPFNYYGAPMHDSFWTEVSIGTAPAKALLKAKSAYRKVMPHGHDDVFSRAVEMKILRQYTCLGLGW